MSVDTRALTAPKTVAFRGVAAFSLEAIFIAAAVLFPMAAHAAGWPVFALLPMHWSILLAGLVFGWRAGVIAGVMAPVISLAATGMPVPAILPLITLEVVIYGGLSGLLRERTGMNSFLVLLITLTAGRAGFTLMALALGRVQGGLAEFIQASFAAGLPAAALQILILPFAAALISGAFDSRKQR